MSEIKVNKLSPRSGTAVTLGDSGDTFTIPSGATLAIAGSVTGFTSAGIDDNATSVAITINSSEQVGIGTTSPSEILHIEGNSPYLVISNTGENVGGIKMYDSGGAATQYFNLTYDSGASNEVSFDTGASGEYTFNVNTVEKMRITSDGKIGIGTTSPSPDVGSDNILEIAGSTAPGLVINDTGQASKYALHAISADFVISYGSTAFFRYKPGDSQITAHDNVKIITGTSSGVTPASFAEKLFIDGIGNQGLTIGTATSGIGTIAFGDSGDNDIGKIQYQHGDNSMLFVANAAERMRIDSSGNVGIGTTSPVSVVNIEATKTTALSSMNDFLTLGLTVDDNTTYNEGVGGGITFRGKRQSGGQQTVFGAIAGTKKDNSNDGYKGNLRFFTNNNSNGIPTEHMRIDDLGNVGIGTTSPSAKLQVTTASSGATLNAAAGQLFLENSGNAGMTIGSGASSLGLIYFADSGDGNVGRLEYSHSENSMRFWTNDAERMRIDSSGRAMIGTTTADGILKVSDADNETYLVVQNAKSGGSGEGILSLKNDVGNWQVKVFTDDTFRIRDNANGSDRFIINSSGHVLVGTTNESPAINNVNGAVIKRSGYASEFTGEGGPALQINRKANDGTMVSFRQNGTQEGSISVSGTTVSYNGFTGTHWSRFQDNSTPTILKGTVLESLDEMCDWYNLEFDVTTQDEDGNDVTYTKKIPHVLTDTQSVGDIITYNHNGTDYQATIVKETDIKHMMSKVSDNSDAKNVYGVFVAYDEDGEGYNDFYVASVGSFVVRIKANETIAKGDLLQSNGDGTAKVQTDDAVRSSSFAKVLSTTIIETYEDGSYLVPCSLMC